MIELKVCYIRKEHMKPYSWSCGHHSVGEDKQIQANQLENVLKKPNDLQGKHVLQKHSRRQIQFPVPKRYSRDACYQSPVPVGSRLPL